MATISQSRFGRPVARRCSRRQRSLATRTFAATLVLNSDTSAACSSVTADGAAGRREAMLYVAASPLILAVIIVRLRPAIGADHATACGG
jgi:hypothetical protein